MTLPTRPPTRLQRNLWRDAVLRTARENSRSPQLSCHSQFIPVAAALWRTVSDAYRRANFRNSPCTGFWSILNRRRKRAAVLQLKVMPNTKRLLELALKGLESERARIDREIADIKARMNGNHTAKTAVVVGSAAPNAVKRPGGLTEEGRRKLSELAKKRWALNRKKGKTTL